MLAGMILETPLSHLCAYPGTQFTEKRQGEHMILSLHLPVSWMMNVFPIIFQR